MRLNELPAERRRKVRLALVRRHLLPLDDDRWQLIDTWNWSEPNGVVTGWCQSQDSDTPMLLAFRHCGVDRILSGRPEDWKRHDCVERVRDPRRVRHGDRFSPVRPPRRNSNTTLTKGG